MSEKYTSLGLMSGTSGDGVDASIINSDGVNEFETVKDKYFEYDSNIYKDFHFLKDRIFNFHDLKKLSKEINELERKITLFHAKITKELSDKNEKILVGFHGQTIYHNAREKISRQLGDGKLLYQLTKRKIVYNFRENDILNGGEGAPLTPIFHQLIATQKKIKLPTCILNIGGISNATIVSIDELFSKDIGPGNCLIDAWVRKNSEKKYDHGGYLASIGKKNEIIFEQAQELYYNRNKEKKSFDTNDFDISFSRGLSLEDGTTTLTEFTGSIIAETISLLAKNGKTFNNIIICGGGRKNKVLMDVIQKNLTLKTKINMIDDYGINGDFVESKAFAFLAIRSYKKLPITFPSTTNCNEPCTGGKIIEN